MALTNARRGCAEHDLIVTSGGVSTGEEDHVGAIERVGRLHFWRLAIKPGRPVALGPGPGRAADRAARQPGRGGRDLRRARPAADPELAGATPDTATAVSGARRLCLPQEAGAPRISAGSAWSATEIGLTALRFPRDGAGILSSIVQSDGLVVLDEETGDLAPGAIVDFLPFTEVIG